MNWARHLQQTAENAARAGRLDARIAASGCAHIHQPPTDAAGRYVEGDWTCQFCGHKTPMYGSAG